MRKFKTKFNFSFDYSFNPFQTVLNKNRKYLNHNSSVFKHFFLNILNYIRKYIKYMYFRKDKKIDGKNTLSGYFL